MELIFRDFFMAEPKASRTGGPSADSAVREMASGSRGLKVTLRASHAGMVNGNKVMYSPQGMINSAHTWTMPQPKPILVHHDDNADAIGRVYGARYAPYDSVNSDSAALSNIKLLFRDAKSKKDILGAVRALRDSGLLDKPDWTGVGELILEGMIMDSLAAEKVLDNRYLTVSVTQRPQQAWCSECGQDWVAEGQCEHHRGEINDETGYEMFLIAGDALYGEVSYINKPAHPDAATISAEPVELAAGMADSLQTQFSDSLCSLDTNVEATVSFELVDSLSEEWKMAAKDKKTDKAPKGPQDPENLEEIKDKDKSSETPPEGEESPDPVATVEEALATIFEDKEKLTEQMVGILNDEMEVIIEADEKLAEFCDAKLSAESRANLAPSTFCGPNNSFPITDGAHVTAAERLIERYEGEGDKTEIMDSVALRAKALGYQTVVEEEKKTDKPACECKTIGDMSDEDLSSHFLETSKLMADRSLAPAVECKDCQEKDEKLGEIIDKLPQAEERIIILRDEWKRATGEYDASQIAHEEELAKFEDSLQTAVLFVLQLTDREAKVEALTEKAKGMTLEDLQKTLSDTDVSEVISFVRSGMARQPTEEVAQDDAKPEDETFTDEERKLSETLVSLSRKHGKSFAEGCMRDWIVAGRLSDGFTLDKASELVRE